MQACRGEWRTRQFDLIGIVHLETSGIEQDLGKVGRSRGEDELVG